MSKDARKRILEAASEAFSVYGYDKTTVEDIARMADKAKASVYYYFGGKAEILEAALAEEVDTMRHRLSGCMNTCPSDITRSLGAYLKTRMDVVLESPLYMKFAVESLRRGNKSEPAGILINARKPLDEAEEGFFEAVCRFATASGALGDKVKPENFAEMLSMVLRGAEVQILLSDDRAAARATYDEMVNFITNSDNFSSR